MGTLDAVRRRVGFAWVAVKLVHLLYQVAGRVDAGARLDAIVAWAGEVDVPEISRHAAPSFIAWGHQSVIRLMRRCRDENAEMRTTVTIDDELMDKASELTGLTERTALLREGLRTLIRVESARRLAALGGSDPEAVAAPRRQQAGS